MNKSEVNTPTAERRRTLWSIQYLRGLAAIMVVFHHARNPRPWLYNPWESVGLGARGVDIFFVISGFIMYTVARNETVRDFIVRRIVRVLPLYWLATFVLVAIIVLNGQGFSRLTLLRSLLLIPTTSPVRPSEIWPMLVPGWTLMYEMLFYAVFAIGLLARRLVPVVVASILCLCGLGLAFHFRSPILQTYTNMRLIEFLAGFLVAIVFHGFAFGRAALLLPAGAVALIVSDFYGNVPMIIEAAIATAIVAGALGCEAKGWVGHSPALKLLGDASYSLYLSHTLVMSFIDPWFRMLPLSGLTQFLILLSVTMIATISVGLIVYRCVEQPMLKLLIRRRAPSKVTLSS